MHGAGAALGDAAPELGAGKPQDIAQRPQQGHVGRSIDIPHFAIYFQTDHVVPREGRQWFDCRALGRDYRATEQNLPWVVIELRPCLAPCRILLRLRLWHCPAVKSRIPRYHDQDGAMGNDKIYKGSCLWGEVQFEVSGQPAAMNP